MAAASASASAGTPTGGSGSGHGATVGVAAPSGGIAVSTVGSKPAEAQPTLVLSATGPGLYHQSRSELFETMSAGALPSLGPTTQPPPISGDSGSSSPETPSAAASACTRSADGSCPGAKNHEGAGPSKLGRSPSKLYSM